MLLTRAALRIVKPLWSTLAARYSSLQTIKCDPCCIAIRGDYNQKRRLLTGGYDEDKTFEHFLGEWYEVDSDNYQRFLMETGLKGEKLDRLEESKTWVSYARKDGMWIVSYGFVNSKAVRYLPFKIGEYFDEEHVTGQKMKGIIVPHNKSMHERYETITPPKIIITIDRDISEEDQLMKATLRMNKVWAQKTYQKVPDFGAV